jgi:hypothetical protein
MGRRWFIAPFRLAGKARSKTMLTFRRRTLIIVSILVAEFALASTAQAGLFDWLFHRRRTAYYQVGTISYYQPGGNVAYYQPAGNVAYYQPAGTVAYYQPPTTVSVAQPVGTTAYYGANACQPCQQQQVVVNYVPQTYYRSQMMRVPVTTYRPEFSVDPVTGAVVTVMRPCTSYNWQVARVPYTTFLPTLAAAPVAQPSTIGCAPATTAVPTATPYYSPAPAGTSVPFGSPSTSAPFGQPSTTMPFSPTPADQPPSLSPGGLQPGLQGSGTRLYPPANGTIGNSSNFPSGVQQKPASGSNLQPVPDPDAERTQARPNAAPRLLNPRDQTAAWTVERAWAATPISWPTTQSVRQASATSAQPAAPVAADKWDDTGWRSAAP